MALNGEFPPQYVLSVHAPMHDLWNGKKSSAISLYSLELLMNITQPDRF